MEIYILEKNSTNSSRTSLNFQVELKFKEPFLMKGFQKVSRSTVAFQLSGSQYLELGQLGSSI